MKKTGGIVVSKVSLNRVMLFCAIYSVTWASSFVFAANAKSEKPCSNALKQGLNLISQKQLGGIDILQTIENSFVVKAEAGRIGFKSSDAPILMGRENLIRVASLLEQKKYPIDELRSSYLTLASDHPSATPDEWVQALTVAVQADIDPKVLSAELKTLAYNIRYRTPVSLGFSEKRTEGGLKFVDLFQFWVLSKQISKDPQFVSIVVNEVHSLFPGISLEDLLDIVLWSHMTESPIADLRKVVSEIQARFLVTTRKAFGFGSNALVLSPSVEQSLVILKASVISDKSLDDLLVEFNDVATKNQVQELEEIIEPLRESVEQALEQQTKE
jgi:hypothetical protein